jgi:CRP-like cAMP-binding protein
MSGDLILHQNQDVLAVSQDLKFVYSLPFCVPLDQKSSAKWCRKVSPNDYLPGSILFYRGHLPYGVFVIHSGAVELRVSEKDDRSAIPAGPDTMIGLSSLIAGKPYPVCAVVVEKTVASFVGKTVLLDWIKKKDPFLPSELNLLKKASPIPIRGGKGRAG